MSQVGFGSCLPNHSTGFPIREDTHSQSFDGVVGQYVHVVPCLEEGFSYRDDGIKPNYAKGGGKVNVDVKDIWGIRTSEGNILTGPVTRIDTVPTQAGSVNIPVTAVETAWNPTVAALDFLTHGVNTRFQAIPDRYYR